MRLIDADALIISLAKDRSALVNNHVPHSEICRIDETIWKIVDAPTIDAVPVMRCGECCHYEDVGVCQLGQFGGERINIHQFCSHGAKMEVKK